MEQDRLIQGMAEGGDFRIIAAQTTQTVETARHLLDLAPVATDALGRALTGSLLLARLLDKNVKHQYVTIRLEGDGPLGVIIAEANVAGAARGYVANPVPDDETLDVARGIGRGLLTVARRRRRRAGSDALSRRLGANQLGGFAWRSQSARRSCRGRRNRRPEFSACER
jgi:redox-regulated HSP33 family molecular chaperone